MRRADGDTDGVHKVVGKLEPDDAGCVRVFYLYCRCVHTEKAGDK